MVPAPYRRRRTEPGTIRRFLDVANQLVGPSQVIVDADQRASFETDWTGRFRGDTPAVIRPGSTAEVAAVVGAATDAGVALVSQGGNTGLVGGSVPLGGEVVLSLTRLDECEPVDAVARQVTVGAGVTLADLHRHAASSELMFGVDLGARDSATVGGMVATNAGGLRFVRYGGMREQLVGLEAVLADGTIIEHLNGLDKDNTGYAWQHLLCGSEGTLAVITRARLRLVNRPAEVATALVGFGAVADAVDAVHRLRSILPSLSAAEFMLANGLRLVCDGMGLAHPFRTRQPAVAVLVESESSSETLAEAIDEMSGADQPGSIDVTDTAIGPPAQLWPYRELHTEAIGRVGLAHKFDVSLPHHQLATFVERLPQAVTSAAPGARTFVFGHLADGNLHVSAVEVPERRTTSLADAVLGLVAELSGSVSAEHGIGTAKRAWLHLSRSTTEIALYQRIKDALDPTRTLNPHCLVPPRGV